MLVRSTARYVCHLETRVCVWRCHLSSTCTMEPTAISISSCCLFFPRVFIFSFYVSICVWACVAFNLRDPTMICHANNVTHIYKRGAVDWPKRKWLVECQREGGGAPICSHCHETPASLNCSLRRLMMNGWVRPSTCVTVAPYYFNYMLTWSVAPFVTTGGLFLTITLCCLVFYSPLFLPFLRSCTYTFDCTKQVRELNVDTELLTLNVTPDEVKAKGYK